MQGQPVNTFVDSSGREMPCFLTDYLERVSFVDRLGFRYNMLRSEDGEITGSVKHETKKKGKKKEKKDWTWREQVREECDGTAREGAHLAATPPIYF